MLGCEISQMPLMLKLVFNDEDNRLYQMNSREAPVVVNDVFCYDPYLGEPIIYHNISQGPFENCFAMLGDHTSSIPESLEYAGSAPIEDTFYAPFEADYEDQNFEPRLISNDQLQNEYKELSEKIAQIEPIHFFDDRQYDGAGSTSVNCESNCFFTEMSQVGDHISTTRPEEPIVFEQYVPKDHSPVGSEKTGLCYERRGKKTILISHQEFKAMNKKEQDEYLTSLIGEQKIPPEGSQCSHKTLWIPSRDVICSTLKIGTGRLNRLAQKVFEERFKDELANRSESPSSREKSKRKKDDSEEDEEDVPTKQETLKISQLIPRNCRMGTSFVACASTLSKTTKMDPFKPDVPIKINVGQTLTDNPGHLEYNVLRYIFKPQSLQKRLSGEVVVTKDSNSDQQKVDMTLGDKNFAGTYEVKAKKNTQSHECALIYNKDTNSFTIQKIYGVFHVKVTQKKKVSPNGSSTSTMHVSPPAPQTAITGYSPPQQASHVTTLPPINTALPAPVQANDNGHMLSITPPPNKKRKLDIPTAAPQVIQQNDSIPSPGGPVSLGGQRTLVKDESSDEESSSESESSSDDTSSESGSESDSE